MQFTSQLEQGDWYIMAGWLCVVAALLLYGTGVVLQSIWRLLPTGQIWTFARFPIHRRPGHIVFAPHLAFIHVEEPRRNRGEYSHWACVVDVVETGVRRAESLASWHAAAVDQIDAAEYAFGRLIKDCAKVMSLPRTEPAQTPALMPPTAVPAMPEQLAA
jgi:hypothetical protein